VIKDDATTFGSLYRDERPVLVELSGEFDVRHQRALEGALRDCLASRRLTLVDLSRVRFMDSVCLRELAVHNLLGGGRVVLCDPSQDVEVGVAACNLEDWLDFIHTPPHGAGGT
jgi:anti-anti-sigma factor